MIKFNTCKLNNSLLDQWVQTGVNVLLIGEKGVGKSHHIIDTFKRNKLKYAYFSGSTLDPWIHLLGIPKAKVNPETGKEKMEFILPENLDDDVEAIFCDEWNRTHKTVRNALLELQQFKSINGRKFPNLKIIWGAVNPPKSEDDDDGSNYDVDELDPAQLDRFHVIVQLPNAPDLNYFKQKFGAYKGKILCDWWKEQPKEALKILSPRRLEYMGDSFIKGLDIKYLAPVAANISNLISKLSINEPDAIIENMLKNPTLNEMKEFIQDDKNFLKYKNRLQHSRYWKYWEFVNSEFISQEIIKNENFENFAIWQYLINNNKFKQVVEELYKTNPSINTMKIVKVFQAQNYVPDTQNLKDLVLSVDSENPDYPTLKINNKNVDRFTSYMDRHYPGGSIQLKNDNFDPSKISPLNTNYRIESINLLMDAFDSIQIPKLAIINYVVNCLMSLQSTTIKRIPKFDELIGTIVSLSRTHLDSKEIQIFSKILTNNIKKLNSPKLINAIKNINACELIDDSVLPDSFLKRIRDIRTILNISGATSDVPF